MRVNGLTPTGDRMMNLLADGMIHSCKELHTCLADELGNITNVRPHLSLLRKSLPKGYLIVSVKTPNFGYRLVRTISSSNAGRA